jgi:hypothetical protein
MLGEKAEAPMAGWEGISEGGREKSTANRFGLLSSRQGLIEIVEGGDAGPTDATPGNQINKGFVRNSDNERLRDELEFDATDSDATYGENTV